LVAATVVVPMPAIATIAAPTAALRATKCMRRR
jgi:hypothetical protein